MSISSLFVHDYKTSYGKSNYLVCVFYVVRAERLTSQMNMTVEQYILFETMKQ